MNDTFVRNIYVEYLSCRYPFAENKKARTDMHKKYDRDLIGKVMLAILSYHYKEEHVYQLDAIAENMYESIIDKYNGQFNLKYCNGSQLSSSQPELNSKEKAEISVRTKATELIGRVACVLWIYCEGKNL